MILGIPFMFLAHTCLSKNKVKSYSHRRQRKMRLCLVKLPQQQRVSSSIHWSSLAAWVTRTERMRWDEKGTLSRWLRLWHWCHYRAVGQPAMQGNLKFLTAHSCATNMKAHWLRTIPLSDQHWLVQIKEKSRMCPHVPKESVKTILRASKNT